MLTKSDRFAAHYQALPMADVVSAYKASRQHCVCSMPHKCGCGSILSWDDDTQPEAVAESLIAQMKEESISPFYACQLARKYDAATGNSIENMVALMSQKKHWGMI